MNFPILADADRSVATQYGMIHPQSLDSLTVRPVSIIDPGEVERLFPKGFKMVRPYLRLTPRPNR